MLGPQGRSEERTGPRHRVRGKQPVLAPQTNCQEHTGARRRVRGKQPLTATLPKVQRTPEELTAAWVGAAIASATDDVQDLPKGVKRANIHWTHVRTFNPEWVQPEQVSREDFWRHLQQVYKEAYPVQGSPTGSVLAFGLVSQERHAASLDAAQRDLHRHAPTSSTEQVYGSKIAKLSLEKYKWPLNAKAHDTYHTMFSYVRDATPKKPVHEIDHSPYWSPLHPQGEKLASFLAASAASQKQHDARLRSPRSRKAGKQGKRERLPSLYQIIKEHDIHTAQQLQAYACAEAADGRVALAEFCTKNGPRWEEIVSSARGVQEAPATLAAANMTLMDKLKAATIATCVCAGCWTGGAEHVLQLNDISPSHFCAAVRRALELGAKRGVNIACVGDRGCGKSTLVEPLEQIFSCFSKPEKGSTFPLSGVLDKDIILWQDYLHDEPTISFTDLLALFVGESVGVRLVAKNQPYRNQAPTVYTGMTPMRCGFRDRSLAEKLDAAMDDRFTLFSFRRPLPLSSRKPDWPQCPSCAAKFYLTRHDEPMASMSVHAGDGVAASSSAAVAAPAVQPSLAEELRKLTQLFNEGALDQAEYRAAKRRVIDD